MDPGVKLGPKARLKARFSHSQPPPLTAMESTKNARIETAMAMLDNQSTLNYAETARAFNIHPTTLARRYRGQTDSRKEVNSNYRQCLNSTQEDILLNYLDNLIDRHIFIIS